MLSQNTALWLRQKWIHSGLPKAFVSSAGILNLPITSLPVDNFHYRALWCKSTGINYNMHGWILCRYCATGWFWWISGLRAVTMWSSSSFTKRYVALSRNLEKYIALHWRVDCPVCSGADQRKHQSFMSLDFVRGIQRWPMDSPYKGPVTRKMFPFDDVIV